MLYLASQSPRRQELLGKTGLPFTVRPADIDETMDPSLPPEQEVQRVSAEKARAAAQGLPAGSTVLAADTIVVLDGQVLGKPRDAADAARMLRALSGRAHRVLTAITLLRDGTLLSHLACTRVRFRPLSEGEIAAYVASGEPLDKAGAYGIQGGAALFCEGIEGDYYNVMGLPLCALTKLLAQLGPEPEVQR